MPLFSSKRSNNSSSSDSPTFSKQLFEACRSSPPDTASIREILHNCPIASQARDEYGHTALHILLGRQHAPSVDLLPTVQELLRTWPGAAHAKNDAGCLPLHLAAANQAAVEVVQYLLQAHAAACKVADLQGSLPLHEAAASKAPFEVVLALIHAWPEAVQRPRAVDGALPLHLACTVTPATFYSDNALSFEVIWNLLEQFPDAVMSRNLQGDTPYDILRRGAPRQAELLQLLRTKRAEAQRPVQYRSRPQFAGRDNYGSSSRRRSSSAPRRTNKLQPGQSVRNAFSNSNTDEDDPHNNKNTQNSQQQRQQQQQQQQHRHPDSSSTASTMSNTSVMSEDQRSAYSLPAIAGDLASARVVSEEKLVRKEKIRVPRRLKKKLAKEQEIEI